LQIYDKLIDDVKQVQCKTALHEKNAIQNNDYLSSKIDDVNVKLQNKISNLESRLKEISPIIMNLAINAEKQAKDIDNLKNLLLSVNTNLDALSKTQQSCCSFDELNKLKVSFESLRDETKQNQFNANKYTQDLYQQYQVVSRNIVNTVESLQKDKDATQAEQIKIKHDLDALKEMLDIHEASNKALYEDLTDGVNKMIDDKINAIPKPVLPSLDEAKSHMQLQLEPVSLDAKNANLRSVNTDTKLHVLEKKIEQIKLMLDQISLGK
jgi:hypothetical protein